jgi:hypothetical protein
MRGGRGEREEGGGEVKVIIAGSRRITEYDTVVCAVTDSWFAITEVISGGAAGVDRLGERYAKEHNLPFRVFPADWNRHGKYAGYKRNVEMAKNADALIAIWDGESRGTKHMIDIADLYGIQIYVHKAKPPIQGIPAEAGVKE